MLMMTAAQLHYRTSDTAPPFSIVPSSMQGKWGEGVVDLGVWSPGPGGAATFDFELDYCSPADSMAMRVTLRRTMAGGEPVVHASATSSPLASGVEAEGAAAFASLVTLQYAAATAGGVRLALEPGAALRCGGVAQQQWSALLMPGAGRWEASPAAAWAGSQQVGVLELSTTEYAMEVARLRGEAASAAVGDLTEVVDGVGSTVGALRANVSGVRAVTSELAGELEGLAERLGEVEFTTGNITTCHGVGKVLGPDGTCQAAVPLCAADVTTPPPHVGRVVFCHQAPRIKGQLRVRQGIRALGTLGAGRCVFGRRRVGSHGWCSCPHLHQVCRRVSRL